MDGSWKEALFRKVNVGADERRVAGVLEGGGAVQDAGRLRRPPPPGACGEGYLRLSRMKVWAFAYASEASLGSAFARAWPALGTGTSACRTPRCSSSFAMAEERSYGTSASSVPWMKS